VGRGKGSCLFSVTLSAVLEGLMLRWLIAILFWRLCFAGRWVVGSLGWGVCCCVACCLRWNATVCFSGWTVTILMKRLTSSLLLLDLT
jgi:hypothetical protein